jgi:3-deoxy-D-manno-octulosonic acid kinase
MSAGAPATPIASVAASASFDGGDVTAHPALLPELVSLVRAHGTLYDWAADQPQPRALRGRAPVYVATLPQSGVSVVVRHAWHGGLLAPLTGDRFRRPTRAPIEMTRSAELRAAGIPSTDVVGFARYDAGLGLARVDVVSRYVEHTADLGMVLAGLVPEIGCTQALTATHILLQQLAQHGVVHPDLNVKNILLRPRGGAIEAMVIDVDVVQWDATRDPAVTMERNVARLVRSMLKWRREFGCDLADEGIAAFARDARRGLADATT